MDFQQPVRRFEQRVFTPLYFAKFTFSEMLPTTQSYTTPGTLSRAFFGSDPASRSNGTVAAPPPARPRAGAHLGGRRKAARQFASNEKPQKGVDNNPKL